ncbi:predicted protein [Postia placenta Mad-698-R]|nr:predicted protein [Postia placenta Mad-698-R]
MPSDAFAWLRDWIQGTANTSTEEPFLAESHAHLQAPHDGSDALKADEDLEGLFTGFDWDLSPRGSPENATIGINPMDTLLFPQPCSGQVYTSAHKHGKSLQHLLPHAEPSSAVSSGYSPHSALSSAVSPWAAAVNPYQAYHASWFYKYSTTSPSLVALHSVTNDPAPGLQYAGQRRNNHYINYGNGDDDVDTRAPHTPRSRKPNSSTHRDAIRLCVNRRYKPKEPATYSYGCKLCDAWFSRNSDRRRHMRTGCANGQQKEWQCPLCLKMYSRIDSRARHCQSLHDMSYKDAVALTLRRTANMVTGASEGSHASPDED